MDEAKPIDQILNSEPAPSTEAAAEPVKEVSTEQPRSPDGKFAAKQPVEAPAPVPGEKPTPVAPPAAEQPGQPAPGFVPLAALVDQRLEARQAKQERDDLRRQLAELQKPKAEPVDFFQDPDNAFNQRGQALLSPVQQEVKSLKAELLEERLFRVAGADKAPKIMEELGKAMEANDPAIPMLANALNVGGPRAVKALTDWYDQRTFDPTAQEAAIEARILAKYGISQGQQPQAQPAAVQPPPVMPSNIAGARNVGTRAGPEWAGPKPLADIFKR